MSVVETRLDGAIREIREWGAWARIKDNRKMYYPNLNLYRAPGSDSSAAPCITIDRACYIEGVVMSTLEEVGKDRHDDTLESIVNQTPIERIARERGTSKGSMVKTIEVTLSSFAMALIQSDKYNKDAPPTIFF